MKKCQTIGYSRVSSLGQNEGRQLADVELDRHFTDKCSGKDRKRPQLAECLKYVRHGDTLVVHSIDRLARNLADLQKIIAELNERGIAVRFSKENLNFTGNDDPLQKLMLQMMGAFAEFERNLIRERQREGIEAAKQAGKHLGRRSVVDDDIMREIAMAMAGAESKYSIAKRLGVSRPSLDRALKRQAASIEEPA